MAKASDLFNCFRHRRQNVKLAVRSASPVQNALLGYNCNLERKLQYSQARLQIALHGLIITLNIVSNHTRIGKMNKF